MKRYQKIISFFPQIPFWGLVGAYVLLAVFYIATTSPYLKGFIEWAGEPDCDYKMPLPRMAIIPMVCVVLYAAFQMRKKDIIYATLLLFGVVFHTIALLMFLPYQAYLMRHKHKIGAVLLLLLFAVLMYFKIWQIDFSL